MSQPASTVVINGQFTKWTMGLFASLIIASVAWGVNTLRTQDARLGVLMEFKAATESSSFSTSDGIILMRELRSYHDERSPPPEVMLQLQTIDARLSSIESHIRGTDR